MLPYLFSLLGVFSTHFFYFYRQSFQSEVKSARAKAIVLVFSKEEFQQLKWTETDTEFEKDGKMYDVANIVSSGDRVEVYCQNDLLEDMLLSYFRIFGGKEKGNFMPNVQFIQPLSDFSFSEDENCSSINNQLTILYCSVLSDLATPPPRSFS